MEDKGASVLARLKNKTKTFNITHQKFIELFLLEEFYRKIAKSKYCDCLVLKGGMFIYVLTNFESRLTMDADFLLRNYSHSSDDIKKMIEEIIKVPTGNDFIRMVPVEYHPIAVHKNYPGVGVTIMGYVNNARAKLYLDFAIGNVIIPEAKKRTIQALLPDFESPIINTYSLESTIAEKFSAILERYELTSRMKDFYDIYYLSNTFDFDGEILQKAIFEALQHNNTVYNHESFLRIIALIDNENIKKRWTDFMKNIKNDSLKLSVVIKEIAKFLKPVSDAMLSHTTWNKKWFAEKGEWC